MALSNMTIVSNGNLEFVSISFNYLDRSEISVYFDSVPTSTWAWVGDTNQIKFTPKVPNGVTVLVARTTDASDLRHTFSEGAAFTAKSLDEDLRQVLHIVQEARETNLSGNFYSNIDMHGNKITNLAPGSNPSDAVTFQQLQDLSPDAGLRAELAKDYANTGSGIVGFRQDAIDAVGRSVESKLRESISVKDFGAVGDGVADDTAAIQAALDAITEGAHLNFEPGKIYSVSALIAEHPCHINLCGSTLKRIQPFSSGIFFLYAPVSTIYSGLSLSVTSGQSSFNLPPGVNVAVGDMVRFGSTDINVSVITGDDYTHGQYSVITRLVGSVAYVSTMFYGDYTVTTMTVYSANTGFSICNGVLDISGSSPVAQDTVAAQLTGKNLRISQVEFRGNENTGVLLNVSGENAVIENCNFYECFNILGLPGGGRVGYGVNVTGNNISVRNSVFVNCKHAFTSASRTIVAINLAIRDCSFYEPQGSFNANYNGTIDLHSNTRGFFVVDHCRIISNNCCFQQRSLNIVWTVSSCLVAAKFGTEMLRGFEVDLENINLNSCRIVVPENSSFFQTVNYTNVNSLRNVSINNCTFEGGGSVINSNLNIDNFSCINCKIQSAGIAAFYVRAITSVINFVVVGNSAKVSTSFVRVRTEQNVPNMVRADILIENNLIEVSGTTGDNATIYFQNANVGIVNAERISISNNTFNFPVANVSTGRAIDIREMSVKGMQLSNNIINRRNTNCIICFNINLTDTQIIGNVVDGTIQILSTINVTYERLSVFSNTGLNYSATSAAGIVTKTQYAFNALNNNFANVVDTI